MVNVVKARKRVRRRRCLYCGELFMPSRKAQKFCPNAGTCRWHFHYHQKTAARKVLPKLTAALRDVVKAATDLADEVDRMLQG